jgi:predicted amidohydrolase
MGLRDSSSVSGVVRAAVVQAAPVAFDTDATLAKVDSLTAESAAGGADLVLFPEAFVSCYPRGLTFGATLGSRTPEGRAWFRRYWESSIDVPGPAVDRLVAIADEHRVHLVIG